MNTKELEAQIDSQLKARGEFVVDVSQKTFYRTEKLRFSVRPHGNPAVDQLVYAVDALEVDGISNFDYRVNKNFDTRAQFVASLLRRIKKAKV